MDPIRFGLIGAGKHGYRYAHHLRNDFQDLKLVQICRRDAEKGRLSAAEFGCEFREDYREVIRSGEVDALIVVVPPALHEEIVEVAARAGKPVLLEKPAAALLPAGRRLRAILQRHPIPLMVAQTLRYNAVVQALLRERERIGRIHAVTLTQRFERSVLDWLDDPARSGAGITLHTGCHSFDLLRVLTNLEAERVSCQMERIYTHRTEDSFAATIRMAGGAVLATISGSRAAAGRTGYIEVAGEKGSLVGDHIAQTAHLVVGARAEPISVGAPVQTVREILRDFAEVVRGKTPVKIPFEEGLRAVAIADACYVSASSGRTVSVESLDDTQVMP